VPDVSQGARGVALLSVPIVSFFAAAALGGSGYLAAFGHEALVTQDDYPTYTVDEVVPDYEPAMAFGPESSEMEMVADDFIAFGPE
jgi:hypothetical protein